jgi:neutral amino acid transport system permease protein
VLFGTPPQPYGDYTIQQEWHWGPVSIAPRDPVITVLSLLVLAGVALMLQRARTGTAIP